MRPPRHHSLFISLLSFALAALIIMAWCGCASVRPQHPSHFGYAVSATGDAVSTAAALKTGATEANLILGEHPNGYALVGMKVAGYFVLRGCELWLESHLGQELSWWQRSLLWAPAIAIQSWATFHNLDQIHE